MDIAALIAKIELISKLTGAVMDSRMAHAVGAFLGEQLLHRGLTAEQETEVKRVIASYAGMAAQLEAEIAADQSRLDG